MARLASQERLLFYPTENAIVDLIATWFAANDPPRIADPCCGKGEALRRLADAIGKCETWGIEVSYSRSQEAMKVLDKMLPTTFYGVSWAKASVSMVFNNPPYDWSDTRDETGERLRHEYLFTTRCTEKIIAGGHHVILVGMSQMTEKMARHLAGWYESFQVFRSGEDFEKFGQIVILACGKRATYQHPTGKAMQALTCLRDEHIITGWEEVEEEFTDELSGELKKRKVEQPVFADIPEMRARREDETAFIVPGKPDADRFYYTLASHTDMVDAVLRSKMVEMDEFRRTLYVKPVGAPFFPAIPPKIGHVSMLLQAGEIGAVPIEVDDKKMLLRGLSKKVKSRVETPITNEKGTVTGYQVEERERAAAVITLIGDDGTIQEVSNIDDVGKLIAQYAQPLAQAVLVKNPATYPFNPTESEWRVLDGVATKLPPLPGREERGLFNAQKHLAIASERVMRRHQHVITNGEMGVGKTSMSNASLIVLRDEWPAIVYCPGHMVGKWRRDVELCAPPDRPVSARIITDGARRTASWYHTAVLPLLEETGATVDVRHRLQIDPVADTDNGRRCTLRLRVAPKNRANLISGLKRATDMSFRSKDGPSVKLPMTYLSLRDGSLEVTFYDRDDYTLFDFVADWKVGLLGKRAVAIVAFDPGKYGAGATPVCPAHYHVGQSVLSAWEKTQEDDKRVKQCSPILGSAEVRHERTILHWERRVIDQDTGDAGEVFVGKKPPADVTGLFRAFRCPTCGESYPSREDIPDFCTGKIAKDIYDSDGQLHKDVEGRCGAPLFEMSRWRRVGVADLVHRKFHHLFKVYIADEVHKAQAGRTDIGVADSRFLASCKYSMALTGTLFGGTASSLFYLLYRRNPEMRRDYEYADGHRKWIDHHGLWKFNWSQDEAGNGERGATTNIKRWNFHSTELPGVMPSVIRYLLPQTLFAKITDLGYTLPNLREHVERIPMNGEMEQVYQEITGPMLKYAATMAKRDKDPSALSKWFRAAWMWPNAAFRPAVYVLDGSDEGTFKFAPCPGVLPKEARLREIVKENQKQGRKTLIFVEQSATKDIRDRLSEILKNGNGGVEIAEVEESLFSETENGVDLNIRVSLLSAGDMSPERRERWIRLHASSMDAMIVNPKLVETGLDLVMFSTIVFFELPLSLYVLWQAMRRVWRLGQKDDVDVYFLVYIDGLGHSMESKLLDHVSTKLKAAMLLYGDQASGALVTLDDEDFEREIIRQALEGMSYTDLGEVAQTSQVFSAAAAEEVTEASVMLTDPFGAALPSLEEVLEERPVILEEPEEAEEPEPVEFGLKPIRAEVYQLDMFAAF